ncbi:unnamed protein product [Fusarium venenatum]|uniref:Uncharacterized protein n=1 Tax=Fusarium venenatum TaxID=56646 RepID=A0A2L2TGR1_9HYPO|nr:uncharacterized protein FVRRES_01113 [Fusarium venenatum]CEI64601.1 unnamed protein product [Fusarium venenatum]
MMNITISAAFGLRHDQQPRDDPPLSKYRVVTANTPVAKGWQLGPLGRDKVKCLVRLAGSTRS